MRKCINCRHRTLKEGSSYCEIDGHFLHYDTVFEHWCKHWAKLNLVGEWVFDEEINEEINYEVLDTNAPVDEWKSPPPLTIEIELSDEDKEKFLKSLVDAFNGMGCLDLGLLFKNITNIRIESEDKE